MSKGSRPRPFSVPMEQRDANHEAIFGKKPPKEQYVPPPLPDFAKDEKKAEWISGDKK